MDISQLEQLGLDDKEAKTYIAILELGEAVVSDISKKSGLKRPTTYNILENLQEKKFITENKKTNKATYKATNPKQIKSSLDIKLLEIKESVSNTNEILPMLEKLYKQAPHKPLVKVYTGSQASITAYEEVLKYENQENLSFINYERLIDNVGDYLDIYRRRKKRKNIRSRVIASNTAMGIKLKESTQDSEETSIRNIDESTYPIKCEILIIADKVIFTNFSHEQKTLIIQSEHISNTFKELFEICWEKSN
jgi:sugar-specific transcriptional regulator TrmB